MATFAEDTLERGLKTPPPSLVRVAKRYQQNPGGRVVVVDTQRAGPARHAPPAPRAALVREPARVRLSAQGEHRLRDTALEHAPGQPDLRRRSGRLGRACPGRRSYHLSDLDARLARAPVLAAARCDRRRRARGRDRRRAALRPHADGAALGARADGRRRRRRAISRHERRQTAGRRRCARLRPSSTRRWRGSTPCSARSRSSSPTPPTSCGRRSPPSSCGSRTSSATSRRTGSPSLDAALAEVTRLARLVDGLLTLARADAARPDPAPVDLAAVVATRVDAWSAEAAARGVVLNVRLRDARGGPRDAGLGRAGPRQPDLERTRRLARRPDDHDRGDGATREVTLHVRDEGPGMTAEQRSRAFDRFWRAGSPGGGTGLGLAIVHRLVTADGGTVELREAVRRRPRRRDHASGRRPERLAGHDGPTPVNVLRVGLVLALAAGRSGRGEPRSPRCRDRAERSRRRAQPPRRAHPAPADDHERPDDTVTGPDDHDHPDDDVPGPNDDDHPHDAVTGPDDDPAARRRRRLRQPARTTDRRSRRRVAGRIAIPDALGPALTGAPYNGGVTTLRRKDSR